MNLSKENLYIKTTTRGEVDHIVEMVHLPTGVTASLAGLQSETSLGSLTSKVRRALARAVAQHFEHFRQKDQPQCD